MLFLLLARPWYDSFHPNTWAHFLMLKSLCGFFLFVLDNVTVFILAVLCRTWDVSSPPWEHGVLTPEQPGMSPPCGFIKSKSLWIKWILFFSIFLSS